MKIDYQTTEVQVFPQFKGGEGEMRAAMFFDGRTRILKGRLAPGASIGLHRHDTSCEVMYFLEGTGRVLLDGEEERVHADMVHYCPKGSSHTLLNDGTGDLVFIGVVPEQ